MTNYPLIKWLISLSGGLLVLLKPTFPFIIICLVAILIDCYTAYRLSKRIKRTSGKSTAKFQSKKFGKVVNSIIEVLLVIVLAHLVDTKILTMFDGLYLANYVAAVFCFKQVWSILENISSANDSSWARLLQKIMIDKAERHFDVDLDGKEPAK